MFKDGSIAKGGGERPEVGSTALGDQPFIGVEETNAIADEGFHAKEIGVAEFQGPWNRST
jgi:hypothetical protein